MTASHQIVNGVRVELGDDEAARLTMEWEANDKAFADYQRKWEYRSKRKRALIERLGHDPVFDNTVGDVLDAIIKHLRGDSREFEAMVKQIDAIKAEYPKP